MFCDYKSKVNQNLYSLLSTLLNVTNTCNHGPEARQHILHREAIGRNPREDHVMDPGGSRNSEVIHGGPGSRVIHEARRSI